ncbi:hypothetical protein DSO57_1009752 [Entomophthora muscae]|uniref:Uncharacterized protein n=1 Tax=Entomophthora muscae TaxID=34485 RepID=A0ACC2RLJ3_9FUNG|nr:hypothetical protein DSO57_1009752 [Entomophthora muscae]
MIQVFLPFAVTCATKSLQEHCDLFKDGDIVSISLGKLSTAPYASCKIGECHPRKSIVDGCKEIYFKYTPEGDSMISEGFVIDVLTGTSVLRGFDGINFMMTPENEPQIWTYFKYHGSKNHTVTVAFDHFSKKKKEFFYSANVLDVNRIVLLVRDNDMFDIIDNEPSPFWKQFYMATKTSSDAQFIDYLIHPRGVYIAKEEKLMGWGFDSIDILSIFKK